MQSFLNQIKKHRLPNEQSQDRMGYTFPTIPCFEFQMIEIRLSNDFNYILMLI